MMKAFQENIITLYGERGKQWLKDLPAIVTEAAKKYQLSDLVPVSNMSFNYVVAGVQNSKSIILKLGLNEKALAKEGLCLKIFSNHLGAGLLVSAPGLLIMERAVPGTALNEYFPNKDEEAVKILCSLIKKLHTLAVPNKYNFYHLKDLLKTLNHDLSIPKEILTKARSLRDDLLASSQQSVLLHGDLHHDNILKNADGWLVIDPKGFIGDPDYEVCAFISNPIPTLLEQEDAGEIIKNRIRLCSKWLGVPAQRIRDWHYVQTVLCWAWRLEDNLDPGYFIKLLNTIND